VGRSKKSFSPIWWLLSRLCKISVLLYFTYFILFSVFWLDVISNVLLPNIILFKIEKVEKNTLNHSKYYFICFSYFLSRCCFRHSFIFYSQINILLHSKAVFCKLYTIKKILKSNLICLVQLPSLKIEWKCKDVKRWI
jgi:hypothetical protein